MPRRVFITVAEVSGDKHAGQLARSLRQLDAAIEIEGHGGPELAAAGCTIHRETVSRAAMGWRGAMRAVEVHSLLRWTRRYFARHRPDLLIGVDSPSMNFHFARLAKRRGIPVLQFVAPQLWAWQPWRIRKVRKWIDRLACILPFEEEYFRSRGVEATFVGHPLFDELPAGQQDRAAPRFPDAPPVIGLLAGSRRAEAAANFPHLLKVARAILREFPQARFLVPTTGTTEPVVQRLLRGARDLESAGASGTAVVTHATDQFDQMVRQCDLCLTVSGTATLHAATHGVPMIVVYRGSALLWHLVGRWLVRTRTFALVNVLAAPGEHIVPEFIPWHGSHRPVAACAIDMLRHPHKLHEQSLRLRDLVRSLNRPGASMNVAKMAIQMIGSGVVPARP